jgi:cytochrome P450
MIHNPDVQAKAQAEIDAVIGRDRIPDLTDRASLPYIQALISEVLRWQVIAPIGAASWISPISRVLTSTVSDSPCHLGRRSDRRLLYPGRYDADRQLVVCGCSHLASAIHLWPAFRAILHDDNAYQDPNVFRPERFLRKNTQGALEMDPTVLDPRIAAFGYGRRLADLRLELSRTHGWLRVCPGRPIAENMMFIAIVSILATMHIKPETRPDGEIYPLHAEWSSGALSALGPFRCSVQPRSSHAAALVAEAATLAQEEM